MSDKVNIKDWLQQSIEELNKGEKLCDIHINLVQGYHEIDSNDPIAIGKFCVELFEICLTYMREQTISNFQLEVRIELKSNSNILRGAPNSLNELFDSIEIMCMPELLFYQPERYIFIPKLEYYSCPVMLNIFKENFENLYSYYSEYRELEEKKENGEFTRWLTLGYLKE